MKKRIVVFTGAGISAESGLKTFRGEDGLWEGYRVEDVATPEAWERNPELVQDFYNIRRKAVLEAQPNLAHLAIVRLEKYFDVSIITQNIDDLHERAGSARVLHLHGLITRSQSSVDPTLTYPIQGAEVRMDDRCQYGSQLRPHVVWFGEPVPAMTEAIHTCRQADIFIVVGTSLQVYPAAGLLFEVPSKAEKYVVDPSASALVDDERVVCIDGKACEALPALIEQICSKKE